MPNFVMLKFRSFGLMPLWARALRNHRLRARALILKRSKAAIDVIHQVFDIFKPDREAQQAFWNAHFQTRFQRQALMGCGGGVCDDAFRIAQIV